MEAEDIIQQKEWRELNGTERKIVSALADTETEYNLIKNMLLVSREEKYDVPVLDPSVKKNVWAVAQRKESKRSSPVWYYAAASLVVILLATFLVLKKDKKENSIATAPPPAKVEQAAPVIIPRDTTTVISPVQNNTIVKIQKPVIRKNFPEKNIQQDLPVAVIEPVNEPEHNSYVKVMTTVGEESELLGLVTEVY